MFKNRYYTLPLNYASLKGRKAHDTCGLQTSVAQYIHLITTTYLGEFRVDPEFGCNVWEYDFDNTVTDNSLKENLKKSILNALDKYEKRLHNSSVTVSIKQVEVDELFKSKRIKKRIEIEIKAKLSATNETFSYFEYFYLGPLSYY
ncbi:MAG: GPW/gp25 family protein [Bacteroidales bacterium]|nr:GPW/gp25 family protein [Bacteroidales bacterium]